MLASSRHPLALPCKWHNVYRSVGIVPGTGKSKVQVKEKQIQLIKSPFLALFSLPPWSRREKIQKEKRKNWPKKVEKRVNIVCKTHKKWFYIDKSTFSFYVLFSTIFSFFFGFSKYVARMACQKASTVIKNVYRASNVAGRLYFVRSSVGISNWKSESLLQSFPNVKKNLKNAKFTFLLIFPPYVTFYWKAFWKASENVKNMSVGHQMLSAASIFSRLRSGKPMCIQSHRHSRFPTSKNPQKVKKIAVFGPTSWFLQT